MACTEIISFPYSRSGRDPAHPKIGLNHPQIAHVRKTVPFRIPAGRLAVALSMSALRPGADVHVDSAACPLMTQSGLYGLVDSALRGSYNLAYRRRLIL